MLTIASAINAQTLYPEFPECAWKIITAQTSALHSQLVVSKKGQYLGQLNAARQPSGFGFYLDASDNQRIGLFTSGNFVYGITLTTDNVLVGSADEYACFNRTTGSLEYVYRNAEKLTLDGFVRFVTMNYGDGGNYLGEFRDGNSNGLGIHYYPNGDFWFGLFRAGRRTEYGCLFTHDNKVVVNTK